jgi:branched-subunit amino acid ABC-type transport system permease component
LRPIVLPARIAYRWRMRRLARFAVLLLLVPLAACRGPVDTEQLRVCRLVLPALHPEGSELRETGYAAAALGRQGVRIDYAAREPGAQPRPRHATCGFGGSVFAGNRLDLVAVETDEGPLGEARLTYLNRFWLAAFAVAAGETRAPTPAVPDIPLAVAYAAQQLVNAVALAATYALLATAYSLIYGLVGRINLAFGDITVVGAFGALAAVAVAAAFGLADPIGGIAIALTLGAALAALWSWFAGVSVVAPLHARHRLGQPILVATAALSIAIQEFLRLSTGAREHWFPPLLNAPMPLARAGTFVVTATPMQLIIAAAALGAAGAVLRLLARSRFGREWRAFADDPTAAALFGVAPLRLLAATFVLAGALAGLAGWIVAVYYGNVGFAMGTALGLKALVAAVLGGIGSVPGAFLGGVLVALIEAAWSAYFDIAFRDVVVFSLLIVVFVLRPGGLLGFSGPQPREV